MYPLFKIEFITMNEKEKEAIKRWYSQNWIIEMVRKTLETKEWDEVQMDVQRKALMPLGKHQELPDYMKTPEGKPLFISNLNPMNDEEEWQDAIEIGWKVIEEKLGISEIEIGRKLQAVQDADWEIFMKSVEDHYYIDMHSCFWLFL